METQTKIRRFTSRGGFFGGVTRIFGAVGATGVDPCILETLRRSPAERMAAEWRLIGNLLWESIQEFKMKHPEVETDTQHVKKEVGELASAE